MIAPEAVDLSEGAMTSRVDYGLLGRVLAARRAAGDPLPSPSAGAVALEERRRRSGECAAIRA
jgi:hypothetical protein